MGLAREFYSDGISHVDGLLDSFLSMLLGLLPVLKWRAEFLPAQNAFCSTVCPRIFHCQNPETRPQRQPLPSLVGWEA